MSPAIFYSLLQNDWFFSLARCKAVTFINFLIDRHSLYLKIDTFYLFFFVFSLYTTFKLVVT